MASQSWSCEVCGASIRAAKDGWISIRIEGGHTRAALVHHHSASPWASWSRCDAVEEIASLHLQDALHDHAALEELVVLNLLDVEQLERLLARLASDHAERPNSDHLPARDALAVA